eukprot:TRINITY_DN6691_c0_g1_i1.p1 TRINITY_DN6691_c0_g1~~TRINITY_DN6691_c0_g1_i1.p1  ORF type:complete len:435 (+),score=139.10 TRINITY_DN6691_c0_g1_i1:160-1464(+)
MAEAPVSEEDVWVTVVRTPALMTNMDNSTSLVHETQALLSTVTKHEFEHTTALSKALKKRVKQFDKASADCGPSSLAKAIITFKEVVDSNLDATEKEAKAVDSSVADALAKLAETKLKQKAEFDTELDKKKRINENMKAQVVKKRKDALKEYGDLQDEMKKVVEKRDLMSRENDPKKKERAKKTSDQAEGVVFKHKSVVRGRFREVETLVDQTNQAISEYYFQWLPQYVLRLAQAEQDKGSQTKQFLQTYIAEQRKVIEVMSANIARLEETVNAIDPEADAQLFMQSAIPAGQEAPPPQIQYELPIDSEKVENAANALLKAGLSRTPSTMNSMNLGGSSSNLTTPSASDEHKYTNDSLETQYENTGDEAYYEEKKYRAVYEYDNGGDPTYANLKVGDVVIVNDFSDTTWWGGYFEHDPDNLVWIPSEYLEEVSE